MFQLITYSTYRIIMQPIFYMCYWLSAWFNADIFRDRIGIVSIIQIAVFVFEIKLDSWPD